LLGRSIPVKKPPQVYVVKPQVKVVNVTKSDIIHGVRGCPDGCPLARAVRRLFKDINFSTVTIWREATVHMRDGKHTISARLPDVALKFVEQFDAASDKAKLKPFTFTATFE
jgi:hypothetical protein